VHPGTRDSSSSALPSALRPDADRPELKGDIDENQLRVVDAGELDHLGAGELGRIAGGELVAGDLELPVKNV
jgi:hypothetical protein